MRDEKGFLTRLLELLEGARSECNNFWACPGPDKRPINGATCSHCYSIYYAKRRIRQRLDQLTKS